MSYVLKKWTKELIGSYKLFVAKQLKRSGAVLLYGVGNHPVSVSYKKGAKRIKRNSDLWKVLRHIDLETWNQA